MRLFYAFELDEPARRALNEALQPVRNQVSARWTHPENLHLTLQFMGEQPAAAIPGLTDALQAASGDTRPFSVSFAGFGTFRAASGLLWVGMASGPEPAWLVSRLRQQLLARGFDVEKRPWQPHLTVARDAVLIEKTLPPWPAAPIRCRIDRVTLMESVQLEGRLVYRPLARTPLNDKQPSDDTFKEDDHEEPG